METYEIAKNAVIMVIENVVCEGTTVSTSDFLTDLAIDSLDTIELAMDLEEELNIFINDDHICKCETVEDIVNFISSQLEHQR